MKIKHSALAAAVTAAMAMGVAGQASAEAYTGALTNISNLVISISPANTTVTGYKFSLSNTATLGATAPVSTSKECGTLTGLTACSVASPVLTAGAANGSGSNPLRANNDYTLLGPAATGTYANSNSVISTAELVQGVPTSATAVSEAQLVGTGTGQANNAIQSTSELTFTFTVDPGDGSPGPFYPGPGSLTLTFNATPFIQTKLDTVNLIGKTGLASITTKFTLSNGDGSVFALWNPGSAISGCTGGITCASTDPFQLNGQRNLGDNGSNITYDPGTGAFRLAIGSLPAGNYSLGLTMNTNVNLSQTVPEPGTLALLGGGLLGMIRLGRRNKAKTA